MYNCPKKSPRVFWPLSHSEKKQFLKKLPFQISGLEVSEEKQLPKNLVEIQHYHATQRNDVGKISSPVRIKKLDPELQTQRPVKDPIQHRDKLNTSLDELRENGKNEQIWLNASWKTNFWNNTSESIGYHKKKDSIKKVIDATHHNSNTNQSFAPWPLELLATQDLEVFQTFSHNKCLCFSNTWFVMDVHWFRLIISCQPQNHICCNFFVNFKMLLRKEIWN